MNDAVRQSELYASIWAQDPNYGTAMTDVYDTVEHRIRPHMKRLAGSGNILPVHVVDFGAGDGRFLRELYEYNLVAHAYGVDFYEPAHVPFWMTWLAQPMWQGTGVCADYAISTDALEHLPPNKVQDALFAIRNSAPHGFLRISLKEDRYGTERGLHLHESVFPADEWLTRLSLAGIEPSSYKVYFDTGCRQAALEVWY